MSAETGREEGAALLSVIVTIVDGGDVLRRFLEAITRQADAPPLEILVPWDASIPETAAMAEAFPTATFLDLGHIPTERPLRSAAGQHELYDRRRARGLAAARGDLIAILEDRGVPRPDWARNVARLHAQEPFAVIGGAIEPAPSGPLNWAFYVCDFGRYGLPFESGPARWVSDVNVSYKRPALEATRALWEERFREPIVHWALLERGETLYLSADIVEENGRPPTTLGALLPERFDWGRLFGHIRAVRSGLLARLARALFGPLTVLVLLARHARTQRGKGRLGRYLRVLPLVSLLTIAWMAGEAWGLVTKRA